MARDYSFTIGTGQSPPGGFTRSATDSLGISDSRTQTYTPGAGGSSSYWGAWMEGTETYTHYYGGTWTNAPWSSATWNQFETNAGKTVSIAHYGQPPPWSQAFAPGVASLCTNRGAIPMMDMVSGSTPLVDIANGVYDSQITSWATAVASWNRPIFVRWNHEMNGTWFNYGAQAASNPTAFVNSWRKMKTVSDAAGATNISWVWCPNTVFSGSTSLSSLYPGDAYVDWTGIDGYNWGSVKGGWVSFSSMFDATYSQVTSLAPSKPLAICEIGCHDEAGQDKGAWITDMFSKLPTYSVVKALVWFNWWIAEGSTRVQWPIESPIDIAGSTATTSFATGISNSRYKSSAVVTAGSGKPQVP